MCSNLEKQHIKEYIAVAVVVVVDVHWRKGKGAQVSNLAFFTPSTSMVLSG